MTSKFKVADVIKQKQANSPLRSYLWHAILPDLTLGLNNVSATYGDGVKTAQSLFGTKSSINQELSTRIVNMSIPFITVETDKGITGNSFWYYAKSNDIGQINFEMHEYEDGLTLSYIQAWQNLMMNSNGTYNSPSIYKKDMVFYRLSSDKSEIITHTYKNYFISGVADISNDYESNDIVRYAVNLTGDSVVHDTISVNGVKGVDLSASGLGDLGTILSIADIIKTRQIPNRLF